MEHCKAVQIFSDVHSNGLTVSAICHKQHKLLFTGGADHNVNVWLVSKPTPISILTGLKAPICCLASHAKDSYVAGASTDGVIKLWDLAQNGKAVRTFGGDSGSCVAIEFHPFVEILAVAAATNMIHLWDFRQRRCIKQINANDGQTFPTLPLEPGKRSPCLKFSPDGKWLCYSKYLPELEQIKSRDGSVLLHFWDLSQGQEFGSVAHPLSEGMIVDVAFHPVELVIATITESGTIRMWDLERLNLLGTYQPGAVRNSPVNFPKVKFSSNGDSLLVFVHNSVERYSWDQNGLRASANIFPSWKNGPTHVLCSGSSILALVNGSSSSFALWAINPNFTGALPPMEIIPNQLPNPTLEEKPEILIPDPEPEISQEAIAPEVEFDKVAKSSVSKLSKTPNQRLLATRSNGLMDIQGFCASILGVSSHANFNCDQSFIEITGEAFSQSSGMLKNRVRTLQAVRTALSKSDTTSIISLMSRNKEKDLGCSSSVLEILTENLAKLPPLTQEHITSLNSVLSTMISSSTPRFALVALKFMSKLASCFGSNIKTNRHTRFLKDSLQGARQISQSSNSLQIRALGRSVCVALRE